MADRSHMSSGVVSVLLNVLRICHEKSYNPFEQDGVKCSALAHHALAHAMIGITSLWAIIANAEWLVCSAMCVIDSSQHCSRQKHQQTQPARAHNLFVKSWKNLWKVKKKKKKRKKKFPFHYRGSGCLNSGSSFNGVHYLFHGALPGRAECSCVYLGIYLDTGDQCSQLTVATLVPSTTAICDPTRANEALWERYQNWHFKFNILFNI